MYNTFIYYFTLNVNIGMYICMYQCNPMRDQEDMMRAGEYMHHTTHTPLSCE